MEGNAEEDPVLRGLQSLLATAQDRHAQLRDSRLAFLRSRGSLAHEDLARPDPVEADWGLVESSLAHLIDNWASHAHTHSACSSQIRSLQDELTAANSANQALQHRVLTLEQSLRHATASFHKILSLTKQPVEGASSDSACDHPFPQLFDSKLLQIVDRIDKNVSLLSNLWSSRDFSPESVTMKSSGASCSQGLPHTKQQRSAKRKHGSQGSSQPGSETETLNSKKARKSDPGFAAVSPSNALKRLGSFEVRWNHIEDLSRRIKEAETLPVSGIDADRMTPEDFYPYWMARLVAHWKLKQLKVNAPLKLATMTMSLCRTYSLPKSDVKNSKLGEVWACNEKINGKEPVTYVSFSLDRSDVNTEGWELQSPDFDAASIRKAEFNQMFVVWRLTLPEEFLLPNKQTIQLRYVKPSLIPEETEGLHLTFVEFTLPPREKVASIRSPRSGISVDVWVRDSTDDETQNFWEMWTERRNQPPPETWTRSSQDYLTEDEEEFAESVQQEDCFAKHPVSEEEAVAVNLMKLHDRVH